ncbi:hypothetical protein Tco_0865231 [Tanacetum coccineum]
MDNPNITMEEYIRLEEEKARRRAIVFNDTLTSEAALSCEPTVSSLNNDKIEFRISFDESNDEDCTDSENDNDKVNMPLLPSPEPTFSCFDDLDFFNDLENEFPAIVYNDAQTSKLYDLDYFKDFKNEFPAIVYNDAETSKSDFSTEPVLSPQHIDEFDLKSETSLSECDKEEQNVLCFNDLIPFNVIYPDELKSDEDNDDDKIDIKHSSGDLSVKPLPDVINTDVGAFAHGEITQEVLNAIAGGIFLYKTPNQAYQLLEDKVLLKRDGALSLNQKTSLFKANRCFSDEGSSNSDTDKIMARMDAMTLKMDAQYKELQTHSKKTKTRLLMKMYTL